MSKRDRETLLKLAKFLGVVPYRKKVEVPVEVLAGVARTLERIANSQTEPPTSEGRRQIWSEPACHYMAIYKHNHCAM